MCVYRLSLYWREFNTVTQQQQKSIRSICRVRTSIIRNKLLFFAVEPGWMRRRRVVRTQHLLPVVFRIYQHKRLACVSNDIASDIRTHTTSFIVWLISFDFCTRSRHCHLCVCASRFVCIVRDQSRCCCFCCCPNYFVTHRLPCTCMSTNHHNATRSLQNFSDEWRPILFESENFLRTKNFFRFHFFENLSNNRTCTEKSFVR